MIPSLINKKIITWCETIDLANKWHKLFNKYKYLFTNFTFYLDHCQINNNNNNETHYEKFKKSEGYTILFCATKHNEDSNIYKLDCCIFLDMVKNRNEFINNIMKTCETVIDLVK